MTLDMRESSLQLYHSGTSILATRVQRTNQLRYLAPPEKKAFDSKAFSACIAEVMTPRKGTR